MIVKISRIVTLVVDPRIARDTTLQRVETGSSTAAGIPECERDQSVRRRSPALLGFRRFVLAERFGQVVYDVKSGHGPPA